MIGKWLIGFAFLLTAGASCVGAQQANPPAAVPPVLKLTIASFPDGGAVATQNTCTGQSLSPQLAWTNVPKGTASFVVILHGTDVHPDKGMYDETFWLLWNISGSTTQLPEGLPAKNQLPDGSEQATGTRDIVGYRAPCPPPGSGPHHYVYELYALDQKLDLGPTATRADIMKAMDGHIVGSSAYVGVFHR